MNNTVEFKATFDECDPAGILFFGQYFHWTNRALEVLVERWGIGWENWFHNPQLGVPIKSAESEYIQPINAGDSVQVEGHLVSLKNSSLAFEWHFYCQKTLAARLKTVHVFVDFSSRQKCTIPENFRKILKTQLTTNKSC